MKLKVRAGTPRHDGSSLCESCSNSMVRKGETLDQQETFCTFMGDLHRVRFKVTECSSWTPRHQVSVHEMTRIAWVVNSDRKAGRVGFLSPAERKAKGLKIGKLTEADGTTHYGHGDDD